MTNLVAQMWHNSHDKLLSEIAKRNFNKVVQNQAAPFVGFCLFV